jgi:hypothetical protein
MSRDNIAIIRSRMLAPVGAQGLKGGKNFKHAGWATKSLSSRELIRCKLARNDSKRWLEFATAFAPAHSFRPSGRKHDVARHVMI